MKPYKELLHSSSAYGKKEHSETGNRVSIQIFIESLVIMDTFLRKKEFLATSADICSLETSQV